MKAILQIDSKIELMPELHQDRKYNEYSLFDLDETDFEDLPVVSGDTVIGDVKDAVFKNGTVRLVMQIDESMITSGRALAESDLTPGVILGDEKVKEVTEVKVIPDLK